MAAYRIDIDDGRNAPIKPLEPAGGGAIPVASTPKVDTGAIAVAEHLAAVDPHGDRAYADGLIAALSPGVLPVVTGEVPPVLVYADDGSLIYSPVE